ncbi:unnamed protein product [Mesocestoides corti]|uniref:Uncharacterized protein n=1 Tax=Mesocestoides corti TaxID=53468 RepID=A0A0R3URE6_MESCO|nr:unnamed protein product [Mesocestoides corti]
MTQRPTSDTSVTVSRQHLPQQQQEQQQQQRRLLQEMAMAYYAQSFLQQQQQQQQQNLAQQLYLHQHSSTLAPSQQTRGALLTRSVFPQIEPMAHIPQQFLSFVCALGFNVGAATSGAIGGAGSVSQVASANPEHMLHSLRLSAVQAACFGDTMMHNSQQ